MFMGKVGFYGGGGIFTAKRYRFCSAEEQKWGQTVVHLNQFHPCFSDSQTGVERSASLHTLSFSFLPTLNSAAQIFYFDLQLFKGKCAQENSPGIKGEFLLTNPFAVFVCGFE